MWLCKALVCSCFVGLVDVLQAEAVIDATFRDMKATLENRRAELVMDVRKLSNERATMLANQ